jgi:hypothetical protein
MGKVVRRIRNIASRGQSAAQPKPKFSLKFDDLLLRLLRDYENVDASEASSFFGKRALEMLESEPNITEKSRKPVVGYVDGGKNGPKKTISFSHKKYDGAYLHPMQTASENKIYVLRGFYPETHIPFKMTLVKWEGSYTARGKVIIGLKEHHASIDSNEISEYDEAVSEAILLGTEVQEDSKVNYEYRNFKCMRPKGMELYHERKDGKE